MQPPNRRPKFAAARRWTRRRNRLAGSIGTAPSAEVRVATRLVSLPPIRHHLASSLMNPDQFWTSQDGQILNVKNKDEHAVTLTLGFWPRNPVEFEFFKSHTAALKFTERSSMARIGIEMLTQGAPHIEGNRIELEVDAFIYDDSFPNATYWKKLMRIGSPIGRLFHAPPAAKLSTAEIWSAL